MGLENEPGRKNAPRLEASRLKGRHLRAYLFDFKGRQLPPLMRNSKVSTALLPIMKLQGMNAYAKDLLDFASDARRAATLRCLVSAQDRAHSSYKPIFAVALIACPSRSTSAHQMRLEGQRVVLSQENAYVATFAAVGAQNQIWAGDIMRETLREVEERVASCILHVRTQPFEKLVEMFEAVSK